MKTEQKQIVLIISGIRYWKHGQKQPVIVLQLFVPEAFRVEIFEIEIFGGLKIIL